MSSRTSLSESRSKTSFRSSTARLASLDTELQQHYPFPVEQQFKVVYGLDDMNPSSTEMHRQDSGYESNTPHERQPRSPGTSRRRPESTTSSRPGSRTRPSTRRTTKSTNLVTRLPKTSKLNSRAPLIHSANPVTVTPSVYDYSNYHDSNPYSHASYFHFPSPEPQTTGDDILPHQADSPYAADSTVVYEVPPATTHYWTSDRTRRREYAAIDAASHGFKGWVMRHTPDCFVPKAKRRVTFDDDTGSVRRYRIELETEDSGEKECVSTIVGRGLKKGSSRAWW